MGRRYAAPLFALAPDDIDNDCNTMTRFERYGGPPDLQAAFNRVVLDALHGRSLDENQSKESAGGRFPDYGAFRDLLLIEMKHLKTDQNDRLNKILLERVDANEKQVFYGTRSGNYVIGGASNKAEILSKVFGKLARSIEGVLREANQQFESYRNRHPRKNTVNLCVLLNAKIQAYTPEVVAKAIHAKMRSDGSRDTRFNQIDAVIYISEKHFRNLPDGRFALGMIIYEGVNVERHPWNWRSSSVL